MNGCRHPVALTFILMMSRSSGPSRIVVSSSYDLEVRVRKGDGSFRWFLIRFSALRD